jgi:prepilin-type N-terminal cleavage/methylation domain-containing protein
MKKILNDNRGMTLIELIVVITVVGILIAAISTDFMGWRSKYKVESQMKEMHIDLMNARSRAMERNRIHFVDLSVANQYTIYEDTDPAPDGDGILDTGAGKDTQRLRKNLDQPITFTTGDTVMFNSNGLLASTAGVIRTSTSYDADYDCIGLETTRIIIGQWDGTACQAK